MNKNMVTIDRENYVLLLGYNPCDIFKHFNIEEMHGLSLIECELYNNTKDDAYIWGWANYVPKENKVYEFGDERFVFINLQRCHNDLETFGVLFHELTHHSLEIHNYDMDKEEEIISWVEQETHKVFKIIR